MTNFSRALAVAMLAATLPAAAVLAQGGPPEGPAAAEQAERGRGPSPETMQRLQDGRIAMIKTALKLSPEQEKLFAPVEQKMRAAFDERQKRRDEWKAKREERRAEKGTKDDNKKSSLPDRIEERSKRLTEQAARLNERAAKQKEYAEVLRPFYDSLSDEQKDVAKRVLAPKGGHGHGPRFAFGGHGPHGFGRGGPDGPNEKRWD
jgi:hypothetical protein